MSLQFTSGSNERVTVSPATSINNLTDATCVVVFWPDDVANTFRALMAKVNTVSAGGWQFNRVGTAGSTLRGIRQRATTAQQVSSPASTIIANTWNFSAFQWDITGGNPKIHHGLFLTNGPILDVSTGVTAGSGAQSDDSALNLLVGNYGNTALNSGWPGRIPCAMLWRRLLNARELYELREIMRRREPLQDSGLVLYMPDLGRGVGAGTQYDRSGWGNHGTVTGAVPGVAVPTSPALLPSWRRRAA